MADADITPQARFGRNLLVFAFLIIAFSLAGLNGVAALVAVPLFLALLLGSLIPFARPGRWSPSRRGRKARSFNYLGHYWGVGDAGIAIVITFAVGHITRALSGDRPSDVAYGLIFGISMFTQFRVPDFVREPAEEVITGAAAFLLALEIFDIPATEAVVAKTVFGVAVGVAGLALLMSWNLPSLPPLMFGKKRRSRSVAFFALLELAATIAFPLDGNRMGNLGPVDVWDGGFDRAATFGLAMMLFAFLSVLTAFGPRFMAAMLGLALAFLAVYLEGWYHIIEPTASVGPATTAEIALVATASRALGWGL